MRWHRKGTVLAASLAATALILAACGDDDDSSTGATTTATSGATTTAASGATTTATSGATTTAGSGGASTTSAGGSTTDLSSICPNPLVVQTDWYPEVDHWEVYAAASPDGADIKGDRVVADMIDPRTGDKTGIKLEIRNGGPATQFELVTATMYKDPNIFMGYINTDEQVKFAADNPTVAVMAPRETSPQIIMWDPATYPDVTKIADLKAKGVKVRYFKDAAYMDYLTGAGVLDASQVDDSYDGKPDAFVAANGKDAQQGFATAEPYTYQNEITQWGKPVKYQLISDAGYDYYAEALAVKPATITERADCLKAVVPIFQAAMVQMQKDPKPIEDFIVDVVAKQNAGWVYGAGVADAAVKASLSDKIVSNGPDSTLGNFDDAKLAKVIEVTNPILKAKGGTIKEDLKPSDIATNDFIDTSIGLSG
jgi:hypothetical protein